jgi:hypothetical protein
VSIIAIEATETRFMILLLLRRGGDPTARAPAAFMGGRRIALERLEPVAFFSFSAAAPQEMREGAVVGGMTICTECGEQMRPSSARIRVYGARESAIRVDVHECPACGRSVPAPRAIEEAMARHEAPTVPPPSSGRLAAAHAVRAPVRRKTGS